MKPIVLLRLLCLFQDQDWKAFKKYLDSPFFSQSQYSSNLFAFLYKHKNRFKQGDLDYFSREKLYARTFNKRQRKNISDKEYQALRGRQNVLSDQIRSYLYWTTYQANEHAQKLAQVRTWRKRNDQDWFREAIEDHLERLDAVQLPTQADLALKYALQEEQFLYKYFPGNKKLSGEVEPLHQMVETAEQWYVLVGLRSFTELVIRMTVYQEDNIQGKEDQLLTLLKRSLLHQQGMPLIELYGNILRMQLSRLQTALGKDLRAWALALPNTLPETLRLFEICAQGLEKQEKHALIMWMANLADWRYKQCDEAFAKLALRIYLIGHAERCLALEGAMQPQVLINVCSYAALDQRAELVEALIDGYHDMLPESSRNLTLLICRAYKFFNLQEYHETIYCLSTERGASPIYRLTIYGLELRSLFYLIASEPYAMERLFGQSKNFESYLRRTKTIDKIKRVSWRNFCARLRDLVKLQYDPVCDDFSMRLEQVDQKINKHPTALAHWLLKEISQIRQSKVK